MVYAGLRTWAQTDAGISSLVFMVSFLAAIALSEQQC